MATRWIYQTCMAMALAVCSVFASAYEYVAPVVSYVAYGASTGFGESVSKFKAELAANYGDRTCDAGRANGLISESNGYRIATMMKDPGVGPGEVGWRFA